MSETITITCNLPHRLESPNARNARGHWSVGGRQKKRSKGNAYLCAIALTADILPWSGALYTVTAYHKTNRTRDEDNFIASLKATLDGIADAGLVADDSAFSFQRPIVWKIDKLNPRVELMFTRMEKQHGN